MVATLRGAYRPVLFIDDDGHREYRVKYLVECATTDGPLTVAGASGLPATGSTWSFGGELDQWAWCRPTSQILPYVVEDSVGEYYLVEKLFSTKPIERCGTNTFQNPLLEPPKISISFSNRSEEATRDVFGLPVVYSSWEQIRGPQAEFESARPTIKIEQNFATSGIALLSAMMNGVNALPLWGLPARTIRLAGATVERKYYGQCLVYWTRTLEFQVEYTGWDRYVLDEGTKALRGQWAQRTLEDGSEVQVWELVPIGQDENGEDILPDPKNPAHFIRIIDRQGNPMKVILNGAGVPYNPYPDIVTSCTACPDGAPRVWHLEDVFDPANIVIVQGSDTLTFKTDLEHESGCQWSGKYNDVDFVLAEDSGNWTLSNNLGASWFLIRPNVPADQGRTWNCRGENLLRRVTPEVSTDWPAEVLLSSTPDDQPGTIFVAKYPSVNLLALNVPAVIG